LVQYYVNFIISKQLFFPFFSFSISKVILFPLSSFLKLFQFDHFLFFSISVFRGYLIPFVFIYIICLHSLIRQSHSFFFSVSKSLVYNSSFSYSQCPKSLFLYCYSQFLSFRIIFFQSLISQCFSLAMIF
jgi:hypothetical protein